MVFESKEEGEGYSHRRNGGQKQNWHTVEMAASLGQKSHCIQIMGHSGSQISSLLSPNPIFINLLPCEVWFVLYLRDALGVHA